MDEAPGAAADLSEAIYGTPDPDSLGRWLGFSEALVGKVRDVSAQQRGAPHYLVGRWVGQRMLMEFHHRPRVQGRAYAEVMEEMLRTERVNQQLLARQLKRLESESDAAAALVDELPKELREVPRGTPQHAEVSATLNAAKLKMRTLKESIRETRYLMATPCAECPAYAICGVLEVACSGLQTYLKGSKKWTRAIPNLETAGEIFGSES